MKQYKKMVNQLDNNIKKMDRTINDLRLFNALMRNIL